MKREILERMESLEIDEKIQPLIAELWEHGYSTSYSCQGGYHKGNNGVDKYIAMDPKSGDGWFNDEQAKEKGFFLKTYHSSTIINNNQRLEAIVYRGLPEKTHYRECWPERILENILFPIAKPLIIFGEKVISKKVGAKTTVF